ncbi:18.1 kDa class I heat shock protein-like [Elaeis guineensis]|uniref:18.1 kDa class I heat shock protein-like n=1 Tax=Elaeis guineensis var. tenera TaxID=51953 RepID=UPI003C6CC742
MTVADGEGRAFRIWRGQGRRSVVTVGAGKSGKKRGRIEASVVLVVLLLGLVTLPRKGLMPYARSIWGMMLPSDDPFRIFEQTPFHVPKAMETLALARAGWKETSQAHVISLDVPGVKREGIKIEVENRVLRIIGERKTEEAVEGEKWHRAERCSGKFWRQFRLPARADMDSIKAHLMDGVLRVTVPKLAEEKKRQPRAVNIVEENNKG